MTTLLYDNTTRHITASAAGGDLWLDLSELEGVTGWALKPEGACRGDNCVPLPRDRETEFVDGGRFNFAAFARYLGAPVVRHEASNTWAVGEAPASRASALRSLEAPDFTLPDLDGREHSLSDYRGRKVFLASWASW